MGQTGHTSDSERDFNGQSTGIPGSDRDQNRRPTFYVTYFVRETLNNLENELGNPLQSGEDRRGCVEQGPVPDIAMGPRHDHGP
jgi:hypothetical protein